MKLDEESLKQVVEKNLDDESLFLIAIKVSRAGESGKVKIILDGDDGITIDQCAEISRKISQDLDGEDIQNAYVLEVTSPGVDHPLQLFRQYVKNVGRKVKVILKDKTEMKGKLISVNRNFIEVEKQVKSKKQINSEMVEIPFDKIERTNIQISFK